MDDYHEREVEWAFLDRISNTIIGYKSVGQWVEEILHVFMWVMFWVAFFMVVLFFAFSCSKMAVE